MPIQAVYEDPSEIPEGFSEIYAEKEGKFYLNVEGVTHNDEITNLQSALHKERDSRKTYEKQLNQYKDVDVEKYNELQKRVPELEKALSNRDSDQNELINARVEERVGPLKREKDAEISALREQLEKTMKERESAQRNLHDRVFGEELDKLARRNGVRDEALPDVRFRAKEFGWNLDENMNLTAKGRDGNEIYSRVNPSKPIAVDEWFKDVLAREAPHFLKETSGGGASGGGASRGLPSRANMSSEDKAKYIAAHGLAAFQQLPK